VAEIPVPIAVSVAVPTTAPITVLIVDDQPLQRQGYRMVLESQPDIEVIGEAGDGAQALAIVRRQHADVVLMDIRMPRVNGLVATDRISGDAQVASLGRAPRVVLVTALDLDEHVPAAADHGVHAILYKDAPPEILLETIRSAAASHGVE
jgi:DNA-binding NarL/FixJ family response regulator